MKLKLLTSLLMMTMFPLALRAEIKEGHKVVVKDEAKATPVPFGPHDHVRLALDPLPKQKYWVGEPVILTLRLVNHTNFNTPFRANFNPRAGLKVMTQQEKSPPRQYLGPYEAGEYPPQDYLLYPFEERPFQIMIWSDLGTSNTLAFPTPGIYYIQLEAELTARLSPVKGYTWPLDPFTLKRQPPVVIQVVPPPAEAAPLIDALSAAKAFPDLHRRKIPEGMETQLREWVAKYPATPVTPYMTFALGAKYAEDENRNPGDEKLFMETQQYLMLTAKADSAYKIDAYQELLALYDRRGLSQAAYQAAVEMINSSPPFIQTILGSTPNLKKYLINSTEMDPAKYWEILN